ncbi:MAG TPA: serine/threonine-protein kinase, partial [Planctomycetia bacterium]|nr:serine/threonine-protein kinase [Planctomycetia bacterium]
MSERDLFIAALQIAEPAERSAWLDRECGDDALLRQRLDQLLDAFEKAGSLLDSPFAADAPTRQQPIAERRGDVVGPYKLLEQIGEGGFGVVFLAEQSAPVRRKVALKILKAGMETRQVVARFEAERQALAIMDHPNIARVFDGGATSAGRPYFVMEYVKGVPVTEYCDQHRLTPAQRLDLFVVVCQAVQHAHQKGIIHRDLKPSNILVSLHDTVPVVKVIDFGVAKALGQALTDNTLFTGAAQMIGTPLYMSPEQAGMSDLDVDTRSDVYSLGVLLYELLTGATPFTRERFKQAAYDEIRRIIREEDPPKPSTRLSDSTESLPSISAQRHTEPAKLTKLVRGDLDWIVMKALEKDRNRRYETADAFAADVQRFLADEPVLARPPSMGYRIRKFVRRNKGPVLAAALVILSLVGGIVGTARQAHLADEARRSESMRADSENRAKEEAEASEAEIKAVLDFVETKIFSAARPENLDGGLGREVTLRRALEAALPFVEKSFRDRPLIEARLRLTLGSSFWYLGEEKVAAEQEEIARDLYATHLGPDHDKTLIAANNLAVSYATLGRIAEAAKLREETLALRESRFGRDHPETLACMNNLADSYGALARHADAVRLREKALALRKAKLGAEHADTLRSMNDLALSLYRVGKKTEALKLGQEALALRSASLGADHPDTLVTMGVLSVIYAEQGRRSAALDLRERLLALQKTILGPDHRDTLVSMGNLANLYAADGRHDDAIRLHQETIAVRKRKYGADHPSTLTLMY